MTKLLIISFIFVSTIFLVIDVIWLSITVKSLYRPALGNLLQDKPVMWAAVLFYIIYMTPLFFFDVVLFGPSKAPSVLMEVGNEFVVLSAVDLNNRFPVREVKVCKLFSSGQRYFFQYSLCRI